MKIKKHHFQFQYVTTLDRLAMVFAMMRQTLLTAIMMAGIAVSMSTLITVQNATALEAA